VRVGVELALVTLRAFAGGLKTTVSPLVANVAVFALVALVEVSTICANILEVVNGAVYALASTFDVPVYKEFALGTSGVLNAPRSIPTNAFEVDQGHARQWSSCVEVTHGALGTFGLAVPRPKAKRAWLARFARNGVELARSALVAFFDFRVVELTSNAIDALGLAFQGLNRVGRALFATGSCLVVVCINTTCSTLDTVCGFLSSRA
jgi:hypothetical protein